MNNPLFPLACRHPRTTHDVAQLRRCRDCDVLLGPPYWMGPKAEVGVVLAWNQWADILRRELDDLKAQIREAMADE